jgi:hypothetical protein
MKANPEKFQAIAIGKQTKQQNLTFTLDGNKIECESEVKLLGVTVDFQLNFYINLRALSCIFSIFWGICFSTKEPNKWAIVKVGHNKGVVDCKFS